MTQGSAKQTQVDGDQTHVSKVECCLQKPIHLGLEEKVVDSVDKDISSRTGSAAKGCPLPQVVLRVQAKVNHDDRRHAHDNGQDGVHTQQKAVDVVELVVPERCQNVVQFNKDGSETEKTSQGDES